MIYNSYIYIYSVSVLFSWLIITNSFRSNIFRHIEFTKYQTMKNDIIMSSTTSSLLRSNKNMQVLLPMIYDIVYYDNVLATKALVDNNFTVASLTKDLCTWYDCLSNGVLPRINEVSFPNKALYEKYIEIALEMNLPSMAKKHPSLIPLIIKSLLELSSSFTKKYNEWQDSLPSHDEVEEPSNIDDYFRDMNLEYIDDLYKSTKTLSQRYQSVDQIINETLDDFQTKWNPGMQGISILDELYGTHNLFLPEDLNSFETIDLMQSKRGFGIFDGIWKHTGWQSMKAVREKLRSMKELKQVINALGKRPSIKGLEYRKSPPQKQSMKLESPKSVIMSPLVMEEMKGIKLSNSIEGLLSSEALLLLQNSASINTKRLFYSKLADRMLKSYSMEGFEENRVIPRRKPWRHFPNVPVETGGPIIICLDCSWSMSGPREELSKAVVLESSILASKQSRDCFIIAFSGSNNLANFHVKLSTNPQGIKELLNFLSSSFDGGTDVTRPLSYAIEMIDKQLEWSSADILLVTDGELQNPPVPYELLNKIREFERNRGLEIHGLLVGRNSSIPLESLCTSWDEVNRIHDCLVQWDPLLVLQRQSFNSQMSLQDDNFISSSNKRLQRSSNLFAIPCVSRSRFRLYAKQVDFHEVTRIRQTMDAIEVQVETLMNSSLNLSNHELTQSKFNSSDLLNVMKQMNIGLVEREMEVKLLLLATLCREHLLLIGKPGTAKSELGRRLANLITKDTFNTNIYFERLLTKYSNPEELFGPLSLSALEHDVYQRNVQGYLPTASFAFLDEIFKANSAILNSLLSILNERQYDNGLDRLKIPLLCLIGASNELPNSEELEALYDRFLFRKYVEGVSDANFERLLQLSNPLSVVEESFNTTKLTFIINEKLQDQLVEDSKHVILSSDIIDILRNLRQHLRDVLDPPIYISDRRMLKLVKVLKMIAYTSGRLYINRFDCLLLSHMLWNQPLEFPIIEEFLWSQGVLLDVSQVTSYEFMLKGIHSRILRRVKDLSSSLEDFQCNQELVEIELLIDLVNKQVIFFHQYLYDITNIQYNLWLSDNQQRLIEQQAYVFGRKGLHETKHLLKQILRMKLLLSLTCHQRDLQDLELEEMIQLYEDILQSKDSNTNEIQEIGDDKDDSHTQHFVFTNIEKAYSKKEAQRKFALEKFKAWKAFKRSPSVSISRDIPDIEDD